MAVWQNLTSDTSHPASPHLHSSPAPPRHINTSEPPHVSCLDQTDNSSDPSSWDNQYCIIVFSMSPCFPKLLRQKVRIAGGDSAVLLQSWCRLPARRGKLSWTLPRQRRAVAVFAEPRHSLELCGLIPGQPHCAAPAPACPSLPLSLRCRPRVQPAQPPAQPSPQNTPSWGGVGSPSTPAASLASVKQLVGLCSARRGSGVAVSL